MDFYVSSKSLKRIKEAGFEDNFQIVVFDDTIHCSTFVSAFISPRITKLLRVDPTIDIFKMNFDEKSDFYSSIKELKRMIQRTNFISQLTNFLQGEPFHFESNEDSENQNNLNEIHNAETAKLMIEFGKIFDNEDIIEEGIKELLFRKDEKEITIEKALDAIKITQKYKVNGDIKKMTFDYFSSHFYLIYNKQAESKNTAYKVIEELKKMNIEDVEKLFSSNDLRVESEDSLFEVIMQLGEDYYFLFDYLEVQFLSVENMTQLIDKINKFELPFHSRLWSSLCRRLCLNCSHGQNQRQKNPIQCNNGVFNYMKQKANKNFFLSDIINVEVSGIDNGEIKNMFDNSSQTSCLLKDSKDSFIIIDLKEKKINLTKYHFSIPNNNSSYYNNNSCNQPISWDVCVSNDKKEWELIDNRPGDSNLNNNSNSHTYECQNNNMNYYRYIRINNITSINNDHSMKLSGIELYGSIITK